MAVDYISYILYILVLATSIPAGFLLAWLCDDEIRTFRRYIMITVYSAVVLAIFMSVIYFNIPMILGLVYAAIALSVMALKSRSIKRKI